VRGGFEPPVRLPVRQFSKLLVSATHPPHLFIFKLFKNVCFFVRANVLIVFSLPKSFSPQKTLWGKKITGLTLFYTSDRFTKPAGNIS
jgi:hypothetical protein